MKILVTGGAGFIGSALIRYLIGTTNHQVVNVDKLTYAANLRALSAVENSHRYVLEKVDITNRHELERVFNIHQPNAVMHLAAESHVDNSIAQADVFLQTNVMGTFNLLEVSRYYWQRLPEKQKAMFRFHHISTDEVYGDAEGVVKPFAEQSAYAPSNPYSASKAAADHLVRSWFRTYDLPVVMSHSTNNYGPFQHIEKLIPAMILRALNGQPLTLYGDGQQIRDWLYVEDHVRALYAVLSQGKIGETYHIAGQQPLTNWQLVHEVCQLLEEICPNKPKQVQRYTDLIQLVKDRPGHDRCYALDDAKIRQQLGWQSEENWHRGLGKTVAWYVQHYADSLSQSS